MEQAPTSNADPQSVDGGAHSWTLLSAQVDRFIDAWELAAKGETAAPELSRFLLADISPALQVEILVELVKVDLEYRWSKDHLPKRIEDYVAEFPQLSGAVNCDLILEECLHRSRAGERIELSEYEKLYPNCAVELKHLWEMEQATSRKRSSNQLSRRKLDNFQPGQSIDDFDLLNVLGSGAFARVFLARQRSMQRLVALKLSADHSREPQMLAQLDHEHIVRVFDQRAIEPLGLRLLYMQYVPGGTLQPIAPRVRTTPPDKRSEAILVAGIWEALQSRGESDRIPAGWMEASAHVPWAETVCRIGVRLARALDYAHRQGVLHRDIKPANVLLTGDGSPKLADFNISFSSKTAGSTPAAYFGGSLAYMSPEQLEASHPGDSRTPDSLDGRSDLYSLAILLWELLHGERPFEDVEIASNWNATLSTMIVRRRSGEIDLPRKPTTSVRAKALESILRKCLAPDPDDRFQSGAELARHLDLCLDERAWSQLTELDNGWRGLVRRFPTTAALTGVLVPNIAATAFNIWYNQKIVPEEAQPAFWRTLTIINSIAYPLGVAWALNRVKGVFPNVAKRKKAGHDVRRRALLGGVNAGGICLILWFLAGFAYPIILHNFSQVFPWTRYVHFLLSLTICGLVSAVYPFFAVTWVGVKVYYPALLDLSDPSLKQDGVVLRSVRQWCEAGVMLAAAVPLVAVTILVLIDSPEKLAVVTAAGGGLAGFVGAFLMFRELRDDLTTLSSVAEGEFSKQPGN